MKSINSVTEDTPAVSDSVDITARDALTEILRAGAQKMLKAAIEKEVSDYVNERTDIVDKDGRQLVVRNGSLPERVILTGIGPVTVRQPRVTERTTLRLECPLSIRQPMLRVFDSPHSIVSFRQACLNDFVGMATVVAFTIWEHDHGRTKA